MATDQLLGFGIHELQKKKKDETRRLQLILNHVEKLSPEGRAWLRARLVTDELKVREKVR